MSLFINLIESLSFLLLAALILTAAASWIDQRPLLRQLAVGVLFAAGALCSMANPFVIQSGLVVDSRNTFAILAGPIGGPIAALLTALPLAAARYNLGGVGMLEQGQGNFPGQAAHLPQSLAAVEAEQAERVGAGELLEAGAGDAAPPPQIAYIAIFGVRLRRTGLSF